MNQIPCCDWLPERARWSDLARLGLRALSHKKNFSLFWCLIPYNKSFIDQACSVKMAGCWPRSFFFEFMDLDLVSVHNTQKKNLANIAILTSPLVNNPYIFFISYPCCLLSAPSPLSRLMAVSKLNFTVQCSCFTSLSTERRVFSDLKSTAAVLEYLSEQYNI